MVASRGSVARVVFCEAFRGRSGAWPHLQPQAASRSQFRCRNRHTGEAAWQDAELAYGQDCLLSRVLPSTSLGEARGVSRITRSSSRSCQRFIRAASIQTALSQHSSLLPGTMIAAAFFVAGAVPWPPGWLGSRAASQRSPCACARLSGPRPHAWLGIGWPKHPEAACA